MKNFIFIILTIHCSLLTIHAVSQPCLPQGINFTSQAQIDNFQTNYPGCTEIDGDVTIYGDDISNLNGLSVLTKIGGGLDIGGIYLSPLNPNLINLGGLENLTSIGGGLSIINNLSLSNLTGLENLASIGGDLKIGTYLYGWAAMGNASLLSLAGLDNLSFIGGSLDIFANPLLPDLSGLENLSFVGEHIAVGGNDALIDLAGLENITSIGGYLQIGVSISGFGGGNPSLISLTGLENVTSIGGDLSVGYNDALTSLTGLVNVAPGSIENLSVLYNSALSNCAIESICDYLSSPNGTIDIHDNAPGCNSPEEVEEACEALSCLPEGITFTTQEQIDNFQTNYPNCTEIEGDVTIDGDDISNLSGLSVLTKIDGNLEIGAVEASATNPNLINLGGLENLTSIDGNLDISGNLSLSNLTGLENLANIGGDLNIGIHSTVWWPPFNASLLSLAGLDNLSFIGGSLSIFDNPLLPDLSGLENLSFVGEDISVEINDTLTDLSGLENITSIGGYLTVSGNPSLISLEGLQNITSIGGGLVIGHNASLVSVSLLENLSFVGEGLYIHENQSLTSLSGLQNLTSINGGLYIHYSVLNSLTGLDNLTSISGSVDIGYNYFLTSLTGLDNIDANSIESLLIWKNDSLSACAVQSICDYLTAPNGTIEIYNNAPGCNSPEEVEEACLYISIPEVNSVDDFSISPNPIGSIAKIEYELTKPSTVQLTIYDYVGNKVEVIEQKQSHGKQQIIWNAKGLPAGIYFCTLKTNEGIQTLKLIKL